MNLIVAQTLFDVAVAHAKTMTTCAMGSNGACAYRTPDGKKCLVGAMIDDKHYQAHMDACGLTAQNTDVIKAVFNSLFANEEGMTADDIDPTFLLQLQAVHDAYSGLVPWNSCIWTPLRDVLGIGAAKEPRETHPTLQDWFAFAFPRFAEHYGLTYQGA
jgi:hypothetical protein